MSYDIVTYCSAKYKPALLTFLPSWLTSDAQVIHIFTEQDNPLEPEISKSERIKIYPIFKLSNDPTMHYTRKASSLNSLLKITSSHKLILLDVDCFIKQNLSHIFNDNFDIGFTIKPYSKPNKRLGDISSGILFMRKTIASHHFIYQWNLLQNSSSNPSRDQSSLTKLIQKCDKNNGIDIVPIKLKPFSEDYYNSYPYTNNQYDLNQWHKRLQYPKDLNGHVGKSPVCIIHLPFQLWKNKEMLLTLGANKKWES